MDLSYDIFLQFLYETAPINIDKVKYNEIIWYALDLSHGSMKNALIFRLWSEIHVFKKILNHLMK